MSASCGTYILVSPVKDEEKYIERTIHAVLRQTVRPYKWIIVDDGSCDRTPEIVEEYACQHDWITMLSIARDAQRQPGSGIIRAFNVGYAAAKDIDTDFVVKFDCDIEFPPDYFEQLLMRFKQDNKLGIASGIYLEKEGEKWVPITMPAYHAAGQTKMVRTKCFADIGGFVASRGWDTVDEIRAQAMGWKTRHFEELFFYHLKLEGSGIGFLQTNKMHGEIYYLTGGGPFFFFLKFWDRLFFGRPLVLGALMMLWGYLKPVLTRRPKLVSDVEARLYRHMLNHRITDRVSSLLARPTTPTTR